MKKEEILNYYNSSFQNKASRYSRIKELIPQEINANWKLLDYGTGTGLLAQWLYSTYGVNVDAVDIDLEELEKAREIWGGVENNVNFIAMEDIEEREYDAVFSIQVMEHVHNHGEYLNRVNRLTKMGGIFIVSIPNVSNFRFLSSTINITDKKLQVLSRDVLDGYDKGMHHIHSWDPIHFVTLLSSCGFEFECWTPTEGMPLPFWFPVKYVNLMNKGRLGNLSYTMAFRFRKVRDVKWGIDA